MSQIERRWYFVEYTVHSGQRKKGKKGKKKKEEKKREKKKTRPKNYERKMNAEITIKSYLTTPPVVLRALIANCCAKTQVSRRIANSLGLHNVRDVYVSDMYSSAGRALKWKISTTPILIKFSNCHSEEVFPVYPLINTNPHDAFWELIVGQDCFVGHPSLLPDLSRACLSEIGATRNPETEPIAPTPGPAFSGDVAFLGHNISSAI